MKPYAFYKYSRWPYPRLVLKIAEEWGITTADIGRPPQRLLLAGQHSDAPVELGVDANRLQPVATPAEVLRNLAGDANVSSVGKRSIARLMAYFLVCEDPQRRFDAREVSTLAHQVSLVRHILDSENLRRVLVADEVGLGKTVEAGLLIKELLERRPNTRIIYFAPARLVSNVRKEFDRLELGFRQWSSQQADARLDDSRLIVSIHRAVHKAHRENILATVPWDVIVVDECHHLSDWAEGGGDPKEKFRLVRDLIRKQPNQGRVILLSGTPHQGHVSRFENLVGLLKAPDEPQEALNGRVIFRTKDDIVDWDGNLLFPRRIVNPALVIDLGRQYRQWISAIHDHFSPPKFGSYQEPTAKQRAAGWRCAQAMQWAASSPQAGLGYLVRQAIRSGAEPTETLLHQCLAALRPYRNGPFDENVEKLFERMKNEIRRQSTESDVDDIEDEVGDDDSESLASLYGLLEQGLAIIREQADFKWDFIKKNIIDTAGGEKIVFFAQPIETVTAFVNYLRRVTDDDVSLVIGGQSDADRYAEVDKFLRPDGPRFLVSSRAGGEGINLQVARRLVHIDVPWNPMDMEQRVGRVHRFGSRKNIVVDTIVVSQSREEHAYRAARERLRLIASTLVDADRFESLYSRVICLVPPEELQHLMIAGDLGPLSQQNEEELARMVRDGFEKWREFDERYSEQEKLIRKQDAGLVTWDDVQNFMLNYGKATPRSDFFTERFQLNGNETIANQKKAPVLQLSDGTIVACEDLGGLPAYGPDGQYARQFGINHPSALEILPKLAFAEEEVGPAFLRWPKDEACLVDFPRPFAVLIYVRSTFRADEVRGWIEHANELRFFAVSNSGEYRELTRSQKRAFISGLQTATVRSKMPQIAPLVQTISELEPKLAEDLRRPSPEELEQRKRHAVASLVVCVVESD
ncbi:MAG: DEAD/DEAH box helicase family protein [Pirellulaceae bacterium]|nr:DEAD/DEAH box helicase family protein [Pirellulaceae bacterium]